jgi:nucleotide-binding universal stress UspA family protein
MRRVLACTSADARSDRVARWAGRLAGWLGAQLTILHVMSQMALSAEAPLGPLEESAEEAMAEQTREGEQLARQLALAEAQGLPPELPPQARLRHGLVVDEVAAEVREGDYDLVVIGGHQAPPASEGWSELKAHLLDDIADQIIMAVQRPVLVIKGE